MVSFCDSAFASDLGFFLYFLSGEKCHRISDYGGDEAEDESSEHKRHREFSAESGEIIPGKIMNKSAHFSLQSLHGVVVAHNVSSGQTLQWIYKEHRHMIGYEGECNSGDPVGAAYPRQRHHDDKLEAAVRKVFDLRPTAIIRDLDLRKPIYRKLAAYGHMGREDLGVRWEKTDRVEALKAAVEGR